MTKIFEGYGELDYIKPELFYSMNAEVVGNCRDADGELWTIVLLSDSNGQRYAFSDL